MKTLNYPISQLRKLVLLMSLITFVGCSSISPFDQYAYLQTTSLKVDARNILELATNDYSTQEKVFLDFNLRLQKAYEYEKNRPRNEITIKMWNLLLDPNGHLLGGTLNRWKKEGKLSDTFIAEEKKLIDNAFDQIAGLESHKIKPCKFSEQLK